MKSFVYPFIGIAFLLITSSCGRGFYYSNDAVGTPVFTIDKNTQIFARKLYAKENAFKGRELISNVNDTTTDGRMLTEVQYLLFNGNQVVYISTVSSRYIYDKTDSYLIESNNKNLYPNSFYFNNFYFGTYYPDDETIAFTNKKNAQDWKMSTTPNQMKLVYINHFNFRKVRFKGETATSKNYSHTEIVEQSLQNDILFEKIDNFHFLAFKIPNARNDLNKDGKPITQKDKTYTKSNQINLVFKDSEKQKIKYLFIPFNNDLIPGYKALKFSANKVRYY